MSLRIGDRAPDFDADSTQRRIRFHEWLGGLPQDPDEAPFLAENAAAMNRMMKRTAVAPTGDVDADFAAMMIPGGASTCVRAVGRTFPQTI